MLVLSRKKGESIKVSGPCEFKVISLSGGKVKLSFKAPASTHIIRSELEVELCPSCGGHSGDHANYCKEIQ